MLSPDAGDRYSWYHSFNFSVPFVFQNKTFEAKISEFSRDKCFLASGSCVCASRKHCGVGMYPSLKLRVTIHLHPP